MRLIDADTIPFTPNEGCNMDNWVYEYEIVSMPTIDPVHAAGGCYCRECDLWNDWDSAGRKEMGNLVCSCAHWSNEDGHTVYTRPNDFCSYGEPKTDSEET